MKKVVVVTGGSRGIGKGTCLYFANKGYDVAFCYEKEDKKASEVKAIIDNETSCLAMKCDVRDRDAVKAFHDAVMAKYGHVDVLVNNAGVSRTDFVDSMSERDFKDLVDTNLIGVHNVTQIFLKDMLSAHAGSIVNISSIWGVKGGSMEVVYSMTKAGIVGYTKALAREVGRSGIRVNSVAPGVIVTDMLSNISKETLEELKEENSLERLGTPEDIAKAVYFLSSDDASFVTGQVLVVDGGMI